MAISRYSKRKVAEKTDKISDVLAQVDAAVLSAAEEVLSREAGADAPAVDAAAPGQVAEAVNNPSAAPEPKAHPSRAKALWTVRFERSFQARGQRVLLILLGLRSPDRLTRWFSMLFFLSLIGLITVGVLGVRRYTNLQSAKELLTAQSDSARNMGDFIRKQSEIAKLKFNTQPLGKFIVELKPIEGAQPVAGVLNMAEIEITVITDNRDTCSYLDDNLAIARNEVTNGLVGLERDDVVTREGKRRLKHALIERLNNWLPSGKVEELYFSRIVVQ